MIATIVLTVYLYVLSQNKFDTFDNHPSIWLLADNR